MNILKPEHQRTKCTALNHHRPLSMQRMVIQTSSSWSGQVLDPCLRVSATGHGWWCISLCSATTAGQETKTVHTRLTNKQTNEQGRNNLMGIVKIEICYSNYIIANLFTFLICLLCAWHGQGRREFLGHSSGHIRCGFIRIM